MPLPLLAAAAGRIAAGSAARAVGGRVAAGAASGGIRAAAGSSLSSGLGQRAAQSAGKQLGFRAAGGAGQGSTADTWTPPSMFNDRRGTNPYGTPMQAQTSAWSQHRM